MSGVLILAGQVHQRAAVFGGSLAGQVNSGLAQQFGIPGGISQQQRAVVGAQAGGGVLVGNLLHKIGADRYAPLGQVQHAVLYGTVINSLAALGAVVQKFQPVQPCVIRRCPQGGGFDGIFQVDADGAAAHAVAQQADALRVGTHSVGQVGDGRSDIIPHVGGGVSGERLLAFAAARKVNGDAGNAVLGQRFGQRLGVAVQLAVAGKAVADHHGRHVFGIGRGGQRGMDAAALAGDGKLLHLNGCPTAGKQHHRRADGCGQ